MEGIELGVYHPKCAFSGAMLLAESLPVRIIRGVAIANEMQHGAGGGTLTDTRLDKTRWAKSDGILPSLQALSSVRIRK